MAAIDSKHKSILHPDNSYEPLPVLGNGDRQAHLAATGPGKDARKPNNVGAGRPSSERILHRIAIIAMIAATNERTHALL
jgi:hypothetical protein